MAPAHLGILAKFTAARLLTRSHPSDPLEHLSWIESGAPFADAGVEGFLDGIPPDLPGAAGDAAAAARRAAATDPATLGDLYIRLSPREGRHDGGEYFTPRWLVEHVLDRGGFGGDRPLRLVDPMCGAGAFLTSAVARLRRRRPDMPAEEIVHLIQGMERSPLAVLLARVSYLAALQGSPRRGSIVIPVTCRDSILDEDIPGQYDLIAGNPPWVGWERLDPEYRRRSLPLWKRHGLFPDGGRGAGMKALLGRGKKDLAMLATYAAAERYLAPGGRLVFVITRTVFKSVGSGSGFRRFVLGDGTPLRVESVDDFGAREVFRGASTRATVLTLIKGEPTRYPVPYRVWGRNGEPPEEGVAEPVDPLDPTTAWLTGPAKRVRRLRRLTGPSPYRARAGAYTGGANGVYWLRRNADGTVTNLARSGLRELPVVTTRLEEELLFPLLRAGEIRDGAASPSCWILLPQDPVRRRGIPEEVMSARYPEALAYLRRFAAPLALRRDRGTRSLIASGAPFYSVFSVSLETMSPWKVVWPRIASRVTAAPVGPVEGRPVVPQETCTFVACRDEEEACYLAALLGSRLFNEAAAAFGQVGGKSFGAPHLLRHIAVPRYDARRPSHRRLTAIARGRPAGGRDLEREAETILLGTASA